MQDDEDDTDDAMSLDGLLYEAAQPQLGEIPDEMEVVDEWTADAFAARVEREEQIRDILQAAATSAFLVVGGMVLCIN